MDSSYLYHENELLQKMSEGDEHSFQLIFEKYRNQLFTYLLKITKSRESAEEIVLDIFLKLWHGREAVCKIENLEAFLFRVAHNKAIDFFRAARKNHLQQKKTWDMMQNLASESADGKIIFADIESTIEEAVKKLSPQRQKVFYLRHNKGLSYDEIARRLDLS